MCSRRLVSLPLALALILVGCTPTKVVTPSTARPASAKPGTPTPTSPGTETPGVTALVPPLAGGLLSANGGTLVGRVRIPGSVVAGSGGTLIGSDGANLIGAGGSTLVGLDGASLVGEDGAALIGAGGSTLIGAGGSTLIGDGGGTLIGNDGATLIGNDGAGVVSLASGGGLLIDDGAGIVAAGGGNISLRSGSAIVAAGGGNYKLLALSQRSAAGFPVTVVDAEGRPVTDADGKRYATHTDRNGNYKFDSTPRGAGLMVRVAMPKEVGGPMLAYLPDIAPNKPRAVVVDAVSTLVMGYVLDKYVKTQPKPLEVITRLPGKDEAATRRKAIAALGDDLALSSFKVAEVNASVDALRAKDKDFDTQVVYVKSLLVAGRPDLGDGGDATKIALAGPRALLAMPDGSVLIAERGAHRIRRLDKNGTISTFAGKDGGTALGDGGTALGDGGTALGDGGPALSAKLNNPGHMILDANGSVVFCDGTNRRIRRVERNGVITTLAGKRGEDGGIPAATGVAALEANFNGPSSVAIEGKGRLVIATDFGPYAIDDGKLVELDFMPTGGVVRYLVRTTDGSVLAYTPTSGLVSKLVGTQFEPLKDVPRTPVEPPFEPQNIALAPDGALILAAGARILRLVNNAWTDVPVGPGPIDIVEVAITADGYLLADRPGGRIWQLPLAGGAPQLIAGQPLDPGDQKRPEELNLNKPTALAVDPAGQIYVAEAFGGVIWQKRSDGLFYRFAGTTQATTADATDAIGDGGPAKLAKLGKIVGMTFTADGRVLVAEYIESVTKKEGRLRAIAPDGTISTLALEGVPLATVGAARRDGSLLMANFVGALFEVVDGIATEILAAGRIGKPALGVIAAVLPMPGGEIYLANAEEHGVFRFTPKTNELLRVVGAPLPDGGFGGDGGPATEAKLKTPFALAADARGRVYIADAKNDRVRRYDPVTGLIVTIAGPDSPNLAGTTPDTSLKEPGGLAFDAAGNLYVADSQNNQLKRISAADVAKVP